MRWEEDESDRRSRATVLAHERVRLEAHAQVARMVNYMLAWDGFEMRKPFQYELRARRSPAKVYPFLWKGRA